MRYNRKKIIIGCLLASVIILGLYTIIPIIIATNGGSINRTTEGKLFEDTFASAASWTPISGTWNIESQQYSASGSGALIAVTTSFTAQNFVLEVDGIAQSGSSTPEIGVYFRYQNPDNFYWFTIFGWGNTKTVLLKRVAGASTQLVSVSESGTVGVSYKIRVVVSSSSIKCYRDNVLKASVTDTSITTAGKIALYTWGTHIHFDNLKVYRTELITVRQLSPGQRVELHDSAGTLVTQLTVSGGSSQVQLDISTRSSRPPYRLIKITDTAGTTYEYTTQSGTTYYDNIWGGDEFDYTPPGPDFTLSASPNQQSMYIPPIGEPTTYNAYYVITATSRGGFSDPVALSVSGVPSGVTYSFVPSSPITPTGSAVLYLTSSDTATSGIYTLTVTGTGGGKTHTCTLTLQLESTITQIHREAAQVIAGATAMTITVVYETDMAVPITDTKLRLTSPTGTIYTESSMIIYTRTIVNVETTTSYTHIKRFEFTFPSPPSSEEVWIITVILPPDATTYEISVEVY